MVTMFISMGQGCGGLSKGTTGGNPLVDVRFSAYNAQSKPVAGKVAPLSTSVNQLTMCFKRLRLKLSDNDVNGDEIDLRLGEVTLSPSGTELDQLEIPPNQTYTRIEFDLDDHCAGGKSVQVTNGNGVFSTNDGMTIRFEGNFSASGVDAALNLQIQQIVTALGGVNANAQIRNAAES